MLGFGLRKGRMEPTMMENNMEHEMGTSCRLGVLGGHKRDDRGICRV